MRANDLRSAVEGAFLPLDAELMLHARYASPGDQVSFAVLNESREVYRSPVRALGWREVESWLDAAREEVGRLGYSLEPWIKPEWMGKFLPLE
jgi:hypothetical protein